MHALSVQSSDGPGALNAKPHETVRFTVKRRVRATSAVTAPHFVVPLGGRAHASSNAEIASPSLTNTADNGPKLDALKASSGPCQ